MFRSLQVPTAPELRIGYLGLPVLMLATVVRSGTELQVQLAELFQLVSLAPVHGPDWSTLMALSAVAVQIPPVVVNLTTTVPE